MRSITVAALCLLPPAAFAQDVFVSFGWVPAMWNYGNPLGVNADGRWVVGMAYDDSGELEAFLWSKPSGMVFLGNFPGSSRSRAFALAADGSVATGYSEADSGYEAFRWTAADGMVGLGGINGEPRTSYGRDISADGSVIVGLGYVSDTGLEAFRWTEADGMVPLGDLPGGYHYSAAYAVSADGRVIVGFATSTNLQEACRWTVEDGLVPLPRSGGFDHTIATAVSPDGAAIAGRAVKDDQWSHMFYWTEANGMIDPGTPDDGLYLETLLPVALSPDGSTMIGAVELDGSIPYRSFVWTTTDGFRWFDDILTEDYGVDLSEWHFLCVTDMSTDGTIVGWGARYGSGYEAFAAYITNAPSLVMSDPPSNTLLTNPGGQGQVTLAWSEPLLFEQEDITVLDRSGRAVGFSATGVSSPRMRIDFDDALYADTYTITISDAVTGLGGVPIDGNADTIPGGDLVLTLTHTCPGDHNRDGTVNTTDFLAFLNDWVAGCP